MRVLFIDEKSWVKKVPYTIHYLAEQLALRGHEVCAVDYDDTWRRTGATDLWSRGGHQRIAKIDPAAFVDVTSPGFIKLAGLSRISTLATHTSALLKLVRRRKIEVMVTYALTNAFPALAVSRALGVPLLFHSIDMLGPLVPHPALEGPAEWIERLLIRRSARVLALTPTFAERARRLGARATAVVPNGVALGRLKGGLDTAGLRRDLGLDGKRVVVFVGTFTPHVGLQPLIQAFARAEWPDVRLVLVGDDVVTAGRERRIAEEMCRKLGVTDRVLFPGLQPASRVPLFINMADVCVSPFPPSKFSRYNIAMKVFEYMACGRPTVCFDLEGTKSLVPAGEGGVTYVNDHEGMMRAIRELLDHPDVAQAQGQLGRAMVERQFSWESVGAELERVLLSEIAARVR